MRAIVLDRWARWCWIRIYDDGSYSCDEKLEARYHSVGRARARYLAKIVHA